MIRRGFLLLVGLAVLGCSESVDDAGRETFGEGLASRMKAPIEKTQAITDKIRASRETDLSKEDL